MPSRTSHISQLPGLPVASVARPVSSGGGCFIYCADATMVSIPADAPTYAALATLEFTLTERSTFNVQVVWAMSQGNYASSWNLQPAFSGVISSPKSEWGALRAITTAATRDAGTWTVTAVANDEGAGPTYGTIMIVVIVGANTEDDCVNYLVVG